MIPAGFLASYLETLTRKRAGAFDNAPLPTAMLAFFWAWFFLRNARAIRRATQPERRAELALTTLGTGAHLRRDALFPALASLAPIAAILASSAWLARTQDIAHYTARDLRIMTAALFALIAAFVACLLRGLLGLCIQRCRYPGRAGAAWVAALARQAPIGIVLAGCSIAAAIGDAKVGGTAGVICAFAAIAMAAGMRSVWRAACAAMTTFETGAEADRRIAEAGRLPRATRAAMLAALAAAVLACGALWPMKATPDFNRLAWENFPRVGVPNHIEPLMEEWERALPNDDRLYQTRGLVRFGQGRFEEAYDDVHRQGEALMPWSETLGDQFAARYYWSEVEKLCRMETPEAPKALDVAIERLAGVKLDGSYSITPEFAAIQRCERGEILLRSGEAARALADADAALRLAPGCDRAIMLQSLALIAQGREAEILPPGFGLPQGATAAEPEGRHVAYAMRLIVEANWQAAFDAVGAPDRTPGRIDARDLVRLIAAENLGLKSDAATARLAWRARSFPRAVGCQANTDARLYEAAFPERLKGFVRKPGTGGSQSAPVGAAPN